MTVSRLLSAWVLVGAVAVGQAEAQSVETSFARVRGDLKSGDIVIVAGDSGETWGQVEQVSDSGLSVRAGERHGESDAVFPTTPSRVYQDAAIIDIWRSDSQGRKGSHLFSRAVRSFADLSRVLRPGDFVTVVEPTGRVARGRLEAISATELTVRGSGPVARLPDGTHAPLGTQTFQLDRVNSIARGGDSRLNGMAIGLAVGAALPLASAISTATADGEAIYAVAAIPFMAAAGAGIGFLIDGAINPKKTLWRASGERTRIEISPIIRKDRQGVAMAFRF